MRRTPEQKQALNDVLRRGVDNSDEEMMRLSLEKGADADLMVTGLCERSTLGAVPSSLLVLALQKGGDPNLMLYAAIQRENLGIAKIAVEQGGADVNCTHAAPGKPQEQYTIGEWSYRSFNAKVSDYLVSRGMNIDMQAADGVTPLLRAVCDQNYPKIQHYLSHGANPMVADGQGRFPLQVLQKASYGYNSVFGEKRNELLKSMLKNVPAETDAGPAAPADAFNAVATGEDIEVSRPLELKKASATSAEPPRKGFQL
ncbi:MAG: hypothetical protein ACAH83_02640 [Alphaproteobacteria bacterium]